MRFILTALAIGVLAATAQAHTWVEQLMVIAPNGTLVGEPGFARGNVLRSAPNFGDPLMVNLIPSNNVAINTITPDDLMCKSTQTTQTQTNGSPRLQAAAGANVALRYQENGHVTLPQTQAGKPPNRGTVYVYGTTQPLADDKFLSIHRVWTADGKGGDGRGVLLSTQNYDDGQCYQVNGGEISQTRQKTFSHVANSLMGADLWCQTDVQIPTTAPSGKPYTLYWVWDWPTMPGTQEFPEGKQEIYTTCMDVDINSGIQTTDKSAGAKFVQGQDLGNAAVASQFANIANPTAVTGEFIPFSGQASATGAPSSVSASAPAGSTPPATAVSVQTTPTAATSSPAANSQAAQTASDGNGNGFSGGHRSRTRPQVSPVGSTSAPLPQATAGVDNPFAASDATTVGSNVGTAVSNAVSGTTPTAAAGSTVTQVQTLISTIVQTQFQTIYQTASKRSEPTTLPVHDTAPSVQQKASCSKTEAAYRLRARNAFVIVPSVAPDVDC